MTAREDARTTARLLGPPDASAPPELGPPRPPCWPVPSTGATWSLLVVVLGGGVLAALTLPGQRAGAPLTVLLLVAVALVVLHRRDRPRRPGDRSAVTVAALLSLVPVVRAEALLVAIATLACLGLLAMVALERTRWAGLLVAPLLWGVATVRGTVWVLRRPPLRVGGLSHPWVWARGVVAGAVLVIVLVQLLGAADPAFARLVAFRAPELLGLRLALGLLVALLLLGLATASLSPSAPAGGGPRPSASPAEWAVPLLLADAVLLVFVGVQAAVLVDPQAALAGTGVTPAQWAREGFGQLVAVTVLLLLTLGWSVRRADRAVPAQSRLLVVGGGAMTLLALAVVAGALSRMAFYTGQFGATSLRLHVVVFEGWLALVVALVAVTWLARRAEVLPRAVALSAGAAVLVLAVLGPDATAATYNVDRYARTGSVDLAYLQQLSDDAVPALDRLPEPERSCVLAAMASSSGSSSSGAGSSDEGSSDRWYAVNVARLRAAPVLAGTTGGPLADDSDCQGTLEPRR